jgi:hypothetical protein
LERTLHPQAAHGQPIGNVLADHCKAAIIEL